MESSSRGASTLRKKRFRSIQSTRRRDWSGPWSSQSISWAPAMAIDPDIIDMEKGRLFMSVFGVKPLGYDGAQAVEKAEVERQRVRPWYVATTRAKDLLVIPRHSAAVNSDA